MILFSSGVETTGSHGLNDSSRRDRQVMIVPCGRTPWGKPRSVVIGNPPGQGYATYSGDDSQVSPHEWGDL